MKKKGYRKKLAPRRKFKYAIRKVPKFKSNQIHNITRWTTSSYITASNVGTSYYADYFTLSSLPNYTEFTNLFDEYMIYKIHIRLIPRYLSQSTTVAKVAPLFIYAVDHDDATAPSAINDLLQYPNVKFNSMLKPVSITFRPKVSSVIYKTAIASGYGSTYHWINTANPDVPHYALKYITDLATDANAYSYYYMIKYYVRFRGVI